MVGTAWWRLPAAVGVYADAGLRPGRFTDGLHARDIAVGVDADFDFHFCEALVDRPFRDLSGLGRLDAGDGPFRRHEIAHRAAEQAIDRLVQCFAKDVPQGHLDRGLGERIERDRAADFSREPFDVARVIIDDRGAKIIVDEMLGRELVLAAPARRTGDFAEADDSRIIGGLHLDDEERRHGMRSAPPALDRDRRLDRHADGDGFDAGDLHVSSTLFRHGRTSEPDVARGTR